jgi:hypothetical protein
MQLTVGPVGPRGQNFRGSGKWRLCVRPNDRQTFLLLGVFKNQSRSWLPLRPLSEGSLINVNKVKSRKQIGKKFCSFLFMLNFGNQFPFRILFRILLVIVVNCNFIISVRAAWPIKFTEGSKSGKKSTHYLSIYLENKKAKRSAYEKERRPGRSFNRKWKDKMNKQMTTWYQIQNTR